MIDATALPLRPGTATRVLEMLDSRGTSAADIGAVVNTEPAITARLLALANSPVFRRGSEIADISRAVVVVGLSSVRGIALGVAMDSLFEDDSGLDPAHWEHALVAAGAAVTAAQYTGADSGEAFSAGLMHDIGQIAMAIICPEKWSRILSETSSANPDRLALEQELFETDHARLGARILTEFGLPSRLTEAVGAHHRPLAEIDTALGRCLAVAAVIAELEEFEADATAELERLLPDLGLDAGSLLAETKQQIADVRPVFIG